MKTSTGILKNHNKNFFNHEEHDVSEVSPLLEMQKSEVLKIEESVQKSSATDWRRN